MNYSWFLSVLLFFRIIHNVLIFFILLGALLRRSSLDPETRRLSLGTISNSRKNSDGLLDPTHAAILFRDSRGVR